MNAEALKGTSPGWTPAPLHPREEERIASLLRHDLLNDEPNAAFDRVARLAQRFLSAPIALIALINEDYSSFKSCVGASLPGIRRDDGPCGYTILQSDALVIPDAAAHPTFCSCPVVVGPMKIRFYAGVPLFDGEGLPLGTLCILDTVPRQPDETWVTALKDFAEVIQDEMTLTRSNGKIRESIVKLERSERKYTDLVSTVPGVVFHLVKPMNGLLRLAFISEGIRDLCGVEADEYLRLSASGGTMIHPADYSSFVEEIEVSADSLVPVQWQGRLSSRYGGSRWVQIVARPEFHRNGDVHWSGIVTDIGALKAAESEIREMNRTLESKVAERTEDLHKAQVEVLERLGKAAEARDDDTGAHILRVARTCGILARGAGMSDEECEMIQQASPMHDIGKISVPDSVLLKPGRLTEEEFEIMRRHAAEGARMLEGGTTPLIRMAEEIARTHHEKWDGTGYPNKLSGEEIPLVGRIVAIADVFDALTSERPYKKPWSHEDALAEIQRGAGRHFDPALVEIFVAALPQIVSDPAGADLAKAA